MATRTSADCLESEPCGSHLYHIHTNVCDEINGILDAGDEPILPPGTTEDRVHSALAALRGAGSIRDCDCSRFVLHAKEVLERAVREFRQRYRKMYWPAYGAVMGRIVGVHDPDGEWGTTTIWGDLADKFRDAGPDRWDVRTDIIDCFKTLVQNCPNGVADPKNAHHKYLWRAFRLLWDRIQVAWENTELPRREIRPAVEQFAELWYAVTKFLTVIQYSRKKASRRQPQPGGIPAGVENLLLSTALPLLDMIVGTSCPNSKRDDWIRAVCQLAHLPGEKGRKARQLLAKILATLRQRARNEKSEALRTTYEDFVFRLSRDGVGS